ALQAGAQDAMASPVHFGELRARIDADLRARQEVREARDALRTRDLLFDIFQEVSAALRADEIFQTLVRRVGQAFGLTHCSFVLTAPGEDQGRVVAVYENPAIRDLRVELERYPEIQEAIRTERPVIIHDVREHPLFDTIRRHWVRQPRRARSPAAGRVRAGAPLRAALRGRGYRCGPAAGHQRAVGPAGGGPRARRGRRDDSARNPGAGLRGPLRRSRVRADPAGD